MYMQHKDNNNLTILMNDEKSARDLVLLSMVLLK